MPDRQTRREQILDPFATSRDTRLAAHASVLPTKRETYARILEHAEQCGWHGCTSDALAEAWECSHNHVAPRIVELVAPGHLVKTEERRQTRSGRMARVYVAKRFAPQPTFSTAGTLPHFGDVQQPALFDCDLVREHRDDG
jgi:hypothetical protein